MFAFVKWRYSSILFCLLGKMMRCKILHCFFPFSDFRNTLSLSIVNPKSKLEDQNLYMIIDGNLLLYAITSSKYVNFRQYNTYSRFKIDLTMSYDGYLLDSYSERNSEASGKHPDRSS